MSFRGILVNGAGLVLASGLGVGLLAAGKPGPGSDAVPPEVVADYIHAVIEADRAVYTRHVVDRLQTKGVLAASEHWEVQNTLLLPAQFLNEAARLVAKKENGIRYRLVSLWPVSERNGPATDFERIGLQAVLKTPTKTFTGYIESGPRRFFQAVYPDIAVSQACIGCHNTHPNSPRRDFKMNDVMGGIVITIPVGR